MSSDAQARLSLLARAGEILALPRGDPLRRVAELLASGFADHCAIDLADDAGELDSRTEAPGPFPFAADAPHGAAIVMRTGEPELVREIGEDLLFAAAGGKPERLSELRALGLRSAMCVPLATGDRLHGAITLLSSTRGYGHADLEVASELARRTAAVAELRRSEAHYRMLFAASPLPMWVYDAATLEFLDVNEAAVRHYGYTREQFLSMSIKDIRPPEDVPAMLSDVRSRGGPGSPHAETWRHQKADGTIIDVEITAGRIRLEGRPAALVLAHDVSERKRLERRLAEAEKMEAIGRLAGGVAHDFNNLLTVITGYAEILRAHDDREELREIARAGAQAAELTRQLLAFSRRQVLRPRSLDLNTIVAGMETMLHRIIGEDISVGVRLAPELASVEADRAQIERVILNLAANARDAMPNGGALTIETANVDLDAQQVASHGEGQPGAHVLLAVSDTGHGMDAEVQRHVFEPFFTTKSTGTGLGLATVFGVVKQTGGSIYVYSEQGRGTTFKIYLPTSDAPAAVDDPQDPGVLRGTETIMIVEDDESVRDLVQLMLESNGYEVLAVDDGEAAARVCGERAVDLLLTDVVMPGMNGRDLAERLTGMVPSLRILFMSGYSDEAIHRHGELGRGADFLEKPFTERSLARKVRELLDG